MTPREKAALDAYITREPEYRDDHTKHDYMICIPSYKRVDRMMNKTNTLLYLHPDCRDRTFLFVRENEELDYLKVAEHYGVGMWLIPDDVNGVVGTRDEILRTCKAEYLRMMDDDLRLDYKPDPKTFVRMENGLNFY